MRTKLLKLSRVLLKLSQGNNDEVSPEEMVGTLNKLGWNKLAPEAQQRLQVIISKYVYDKD